MLCPLGILLVLVYRQSPTSLIGEPQGWRGWGPSLGALTMLACGRRGSGLGEAAEARPHARGSRLDVHTGLSTWESLDVAANFYLRGGPFGARSRGWSTLTMYTTHTYIHTHIHTYIQHGS